MLKRTLMLTAGATGLLVALAACGGGEPEPADTTPVIGDDDDDDDSTDTYTSGGYLDVKTLFIGGWFTYDEDSQTTVSGMYDGSPIASALYIRLGTASFQGDINDQANYCTIYVDTDGATNESWATDGGYLFGFIAPQGSPSITSDCLDKGFDPDWFGGPPEDLATTYPMGFAIGGDPSTVVTDWMAQVGVDPEDEDDYIGGIFDSGPWALPDAEESIYWSAYEVDSEFNIDFEATVDRFSISDGGGALSTGFYEFGLVYYWTFQ
jgi:hypothetical protein